MNVIPVWIVSFRTRVVLTVEIVPSETTEAKPEVEEDSTAITTGFVGELP